MFLFIAVVKLDVRLDKTGLTSDRSKLPLVHSTTERTESAVLRIAY